MSHKIIQGDCMEVLKTLADNSVDSIITDPPYELGFMGKSWDATGIAYNVEMWKECLRVLKHGGHLLSFGGSRTYHSMASAIEDAGFEIRDQIMWIYGSGFPKSLNIGKQIDKQDTIDFRKQVGDIIKNARMKKGYSMDELCLALGLNNEGHGGMINHYENGRATPTIELWQKLCALLEIRDLQDYSKIKQGRTVVVGKIENPITWFGEGLKEIATTEAAKQWDGWGTALKPAHEPIVVARKPLIGTVAENVLKYGTGGMNIDACRVATEENISNHSRGSESAVSKGIYGDSSQQNTHQTEGQKLGRFPANIILDEEAGQMLDEQSGISRSIARPPRKANTEDSMTYSSNKFGQQTGQEHTDFGGASRFFYCAKASKSERNFGCNELPEKEIQIQQPHNSKSLEARYAMKSFNHHPTVKPIKLMEYLIKLVTPPSGTVLDPFTGSGSTGCAAVKLGFNFIGIEKEEQYVRIAEARIAAFHDRADRSRQETLI